MGISICYSLTKFILILFNIVFLVVGCAACGCSAWALFSGFGTGSLEGRAGLFVLLAWGGALALGSLAAITGAVRGSASLLALAFALLALSGVAEGAAAWWGAAHLPQLKRALSDKFEHIVLHEYGVSETSTKVINTIQKELQCCGGQGARDWQNSVWAQHERIKLDDARAQAPSAAAHLALDLSVTAPASHYYVPESCCQLNETQDEDKCNLARRVVSTANTADGLHPAACTPRAIKYLENIGHYLLAAGAALLLAHALSLLLTLGLCLNTRPRNHYKA